MCVIIILMCVMCMYVCNENDIIINIINDNVYVCIIINIIIIINNVNDNMY